MSPRIRHELSPRGSIDRSELNAGDTSGKYDVLLLWDKKGQAIVNIKASDIAYYMMLSLSFNEFAWNPSLDLYTEDDTDKLRECR